MIVIERETIEDVRAEMGAMGEAGEVDGLKVGYVGRGAAVGAGLTVEVGTVVALPAALAGSGLVVESLGQEISEKFQTHRPMCGRTHIWLEWEFHRIAGDWNQWSRRIYDLRIGCEGRSGE
jgi:hypothetical protein